METLLAKQIQDTPYQFFVSVTGGGQSFIGDYTMVSGASKNLVGAFIPYNQELFNKFINGKPDTYASSEAARRLAVASYQECLAAKVPSAHAIGIGAASSVVKDGERIGRQHKIFVAIHTFCYTSVVSVILNQGRTRIEEDYLVNQLIFNNLLYATLKHDNILAKIILKDGETYNFEKNNNENYRLILNGMTDFVGSESIVANNHIAIYGGSWNPLHDAHKEIHKLAGEILGQKIYFELTCRNADKGSLDFIELDKRIKEIENYPFIISGVPTVKQKIDMLRKYNPKADITVVMGADTWNRIWNPKYGYPPKELEEFFAANRVKFLVFGRDKIPLVSEYGKNLMIKSDAAANFDISLSSSVMRRIKNESN